MIDTIKHGLGVMAFILIIACGTVLPLYWIHKEIIREESYVYMIQDGRGKQYFSNSVTETNKTIQFTDMEDRQITLRGVYTLIKRK